jgi:chromosome segregation ATPase
VQLNALLEEFEPDLKALGHIIGEYESDCAARLSFKDRESAQREQRFSDEIAALEKRYAALESSHSAGLRKIAELKAALASKEGELAEVKAKTAEEETALNGKYVARMQELYDKVSRKELEMLARWEEKNAGIDSKIQGLEDEYAAKMKQLKLRERAMEEDFNARKAELIRTFDKIKGGLEAREKALSEKEARGGKV